jgi:RND family efflux transporter MFP subunit
MKVEMDERADAKEMHFLPAELSPQPPRRRRTWHLWLVLFLALGAVAAVVISGILPRLRDQKVLQAETREHAVPRVSTVQPRRAAPAQEIVLPATIQAFTDAPIYARTNGYLKRWVVDIGARVRAGQLLAEIDTPEVDQQLQQARADLATAEANYRLAEITAARYLDLLKTNSVSQQDADNAVGSKDAKKAALDSAQFNVKRLEEMQSFQKIYAPFEGMITARNTDIGALIDSGSGGGPTRELFHIAATNQLRVYVHVPQVYSRAARPGLPATLSLAEFPGRLFHGTLVRTSNAIDADTRTLLAEIDVDNPKGEILPGAYGEAHLKVPAVNPTFILPVTTLLFRSEGLRVGVVQGGMRVVLTPVTLGRDFGTEVEVVSGLSGDEAVIINPSDSLVSGERVQVVQPGGTEGKKEDNL